MQYRDFDCLIEPAIEGYKIRVLNSPAGEAEGKAQLPFSDLEIENFMLKFSNLNVRRRRIDSQALGVAKKFGGQLFQAFFTEAVRDCWHASILEATNKQSGLRLRLRLAKAPKLIELPWEYLYNPAIDSFFCLSTVTPLVRYLDVPQPNRPLNVKPPLNVLVMASTPSYYPMLDVTQEWDNLKTALSHLESSGLVSVDRLETATLAALQKKLHEREYHIFHFIGHGSFDELEHDGKLLLENEEGHADAMSGQKLATLLRDENTLRLAILNACDGARTSRTYPFAGTAQTLIQKGLPAVIAMQFEITDDAAVCFARAFYDMLAYGQPVEMALTEARKALSNANHELEWATPVLYMRAPDGHIFDINSPEPNNLKPELKPKLTSEQTQQQDDFERLYEMQTLLSVLYYLNAITAEEKRLSITDIANALGIGRRRVLVKTLYEQTKTGLIEQLKVQGNAFWKISDVGRKMVSRLQESLGNEQIGENVKFQGKLRDYSGLTSECETRSHQLMTSPGSHHA